VQLKGFCGEIKKGVHSPSSVSSEDSALVTTLWPDLAVNALLDVLWSEKNNEG